MQTLLLTNFKLCQMLVPDGLYPMLASILRNRLGKAMQKLLADQP